MYTLEDIIYFESVGSIVGVLFSSVLARQKVAAKTDDLLRISAVRIKALEKIAHHLENSEKSRNESGTLAALEALLEEVNTIKGVIPICSCCKKVRTDTEYWEQIERYISSRTKAEFSHTLCPDCFQKWCEKEGISMEDL